jgi:hypothetical protein
MRAALQSARLMVKCLRTARMLHSVTSLIEKQAGPVICTFRPGIRIRGGKHRVSRLHGNIWTVTIPLMVVLLVANPTAAQVQNGSFEELGPNRLPIGWHFTKAGEPAHEEDGDVKVRVLEGDAHSGREDNRVKPRRLLVSAWTVRSISWARCLNFSFYEVCFQAEMRYSRFL